MDRRSDQGLFLFDQEYYSILGNFTLLAVAALTVYGISTNVTETTTTSNQTLTTITTIASNTSTTNMPTNVTEPTITSNQTLTTGNISHSID